MGWMILHLHHRGDSGRNIDRAMRITAVGICMPSARRQVASPDAKEHAYPIQFARQNPMAIISPNTPQRRARSSGLASSEMYIGIVGLRIPSATPATKRPTIINGTPFAAAWNAEPTIVKNVETRRVFRRPSFSRRRPLIRHPIAFPADPMDTIAPVRDVTFLTVDLRSDKAQLRGENLPPGP